MITIVYLIYLGLALAPICVSIYLIAKSGKEEKND